MSRVRVGEAGGTKEGSLARIVGGRGRGWWKAREIRSQRHRLLPHF